MLLNVLPAPALDAIGPFVYADHLGPLRRFSEKTGVHAHAGIDVLTYVLKGGVEHHDSLGNRTFAAAGGGHWLRAGRGALHAETYASTGRGFFHALDIWLRLPPEEQDCAPEYRLIHPQMFPEISERQSTSRLISGSVDPLFSQSGVVPSLGSSVLLHLKIGPGDCIRLPDHLCPEIGCYVLSGSIQVNAEQPDLEKGMLVALDPEQELAVSNWSEQEAQVIVFGGARASRPLIYRRAFVYDSIEAAEQAEIRLARGEMGELCE